jgi:ATP-dependent DNA helicase RecQ
MGVYRQLVAAGLADVDLEGYGALKLNARSWDVMKGREEVALRRDPRPAPVTRGSRTLAAAPGGERTEEERELWESLRALRLEISREQGVPPYAVFSDRTLAEMVRFRPSRVEDLLAVSGVGRTKLAVYGERFIGVLRSHEDEHGRPGGLEPLPAPRTEKLRTRADGLSATEQASLDALRETGSVEGVVASRGLKPATVFGHLTRAVALGLASAAEVTGLTGAQLSRIEEALENAGGRGSSGLVAAAEALEGEFDYDVLRCVRAGLLRNRMEA